MRSMSGFGKGTKEFNELDISVEIKSVNSRFLDFYIRSPKETNEFEHDIKTFIKQKIARGKLEVYINFDYKNSSDRIALNYDLLDRYDEIFKELNDRYHIGEKVRISNYLMVKDSVIINDESIDPKVLKNYLFETIDVALTHLIEMREKEGKYLLGDLDSYINQLEKLLVVIEQEYPNILDFHKNNIHNRVSDILDDPALLDKGVLETELAMYAEKKDISEEILRLKSHFSQFRSIISSSESIGRKLDFITQELNREVNTIGSKCVGYEISSVIIDMKSIIEKIREQVQNVE